MTLLETYLRVLDVSTHVLRQEMVSKLRGRADAQASDYKRCHLINYINNLYRLWTWRTVASPRQFVISQIFD